MVIHKELNDSSVLTVPLIIFCKKKKIPEKYAIANKMPSVLGRLLGNVTGYRLQVTLFKM